MTGNNTSTLHCYQIRKKGEARNDHKVKTVFFWSKQLYNPFTQNLGLEIKFESGDDESDAKYERIKNTNIKEGVNDGNVKVSNNDVETVDIPGDDTPQGFLY